MSQSRETRNSSECVHLFTERDSKNWGEEALHRKGIKKITKIWFPKTEHALGYKQTYFIPRTCWFLYCGQTGFFLLLLLLNDCASEVAGSHSTLQKAEQFSHGLESSWIHPRDQNKFHSTLPPAGLVSEGRCRLWVGRVCGRASGHASVCWRD